MSTESTKNSNSEKFNFYLSNELRTAIVELARETGSASESKLILRAIALMRIALKVQGEGSSIILSDENSQETTKIMF